MYCKLFALHLAATPPPGAFCRSWRLFEFAFVLSWCSKKLCRSLCVAAFKSDDSLRSLAERRGTRALRQALVVTTCLASLEVNLSHGLSNRYTQVHISTSSATEVRGCSEIVNGRPPTLAGVTCKQATSVGPWLAST
jgi:hypothetical protein